MSIYKGKQLISGAGITAAIKANDLFDFKWTDYELTDMSWIRADNFNWHDGTVYTEAYTHLLNDIDGKTATTETVANITITYYLADDGHKIVPIDQENTVLAIYLAAGVAWYYILDTVNQRFKLPRENPESANLYTVDTSANVAIKGNGRTLGLTDGTTEGGSIIRNMSSLSGSASILINRNFLDSELGLGTTDDRNWGTAQTTVGIVSNASKSGLVGTATITNTSYYRGNKYLYAYAGQFSKSALEQTAGLKQSAFNNKVDLDGGNLLTGAGADFRNISKWSTNVTDCITEIPQDIKLELDNGTLTLKAGSKVYVPNGFEEDGTTPKFDVITTSTDLSYSYTGSENVTCFVIYRKDTNDLTICNIAVTFSGTTIPTTGFLYNTSINKVTFYQNDSIVWNNGSFPIGVVTITTNLIESLSQVFNGFGYIGSTAYILPGVKGLIPNGRNEDGTLKNTEFIVDKVEMATRTWETAFGQGVYYNCTPINGLKMWFYNIEYSSNVIPAYREYSMWYKPDTNERFYNHEIADTGWVKVNSICLFTAGADGTTKITEMHDAKKPIRFLDNSTPHVIESFRNGYSWYQIWSNGWVEQGGVVLSGNGTSGTITFMVPFADTKYSWQASLSNNAANNFFVLYGSGATTTTINWYKSNAGVYGSWEVKGYAAFA